MLSTTGSYIQEMECDYMYKLIDDTVISFVYFGSKESIEHGGDFAHLHKVSTHDKFTYPE